MTDTEIIEALKAKLATPGGRHLYGVLGSYKALGDFAKKIREAVTPDGHQFPETVSVNRGILSTIPDRDFNEMVEYEARRPQPTAGHVREAFEAFIRSTLKGRGLVVLASLEMVFAYNLELSLLRTLAADNDRILLLLPGRREGGNIVMFDGLTDGNESYALPTNLIANNHLWELER